MSTSTELTGRAPALVLAEQPEQVQQHLAQLRRRAVAGLHRLEHDVAKLSAWRTEVRKHPHLAVVLSFTAGYILARLLTTTPAGKQH